MVEMKKTGRAIKDLPVSWCGGCAEESPGALSYSTACSPHQLRRHIREMWHVIIPAGV
jgi:hypothetical protein